MTLRTERKKYTKKKRREEMVIERARAHSAYGWLSAEPEAKEIKWSHARENTSRRKKLPDRANWKYLLASPGQTFREASVLFIYFIRRNCTSSFHADTLFIVFIILAEAKFCVCTFLINSIDSPVIFLRLRLFYEQCFTLFFLSFVMSETFR